MKKYENGQYLEMTEEDLAGLQVPEEEVAPSMEDRLAMLEARLKEMEAK